MLKHSLKYYLLVLFILLIDQLSKLWVHFNMDMGQLGAIKLVGNWLKLHYTLNPGMAFGLQLGFRYGKLLLTLGRLVAVGLIGWHIWQLGHATQTAPGALWGWALVLGGAVGNVIDSTFYGVLLDNAVHSAPMAWFHGQVIDMVYLDFGSVRVPWWLPWLGGRRVDLFPIFNLADAAISLGVVALLWARRSNLGGPSNQLSTSCD